MMEAMEAARNELFTLMLQEEVNGTNPEKVEGAISIFKAVANACDISDEEARAIIENLRARAIEEA